MARILITDDSVVMRKNLKSILTTGGHSVIGEAANGQQACAEYEKLKPDLVTMDITMPVMDGIEAVKKLIKDFPDAKIIMISALDQKRMVFEALENGAKHYIVKPITAEKVLHIIQEVLQEEDLQENLSEVSSIPDQGTPFSIENVNGEFIVKIHEQMDGSQLQFLQMAVQGFLFVRPLQVTFDFGHTALLDLQVLKQLGTIGKSIHDMGGICGVKAFNAQLIKQIENAGWGEFTTSQTNDSTEGEV